MNEEVKPGFEPVTEEKPVPVFYFYKGKPADKNMLLAYSPKRGGWAL